MKEFDSDDAFFHEILSKSKLNVPFPDFEDNLMGLIEKKLSKNTSIKRDIKLSWLFFILGSAFGITLTIILSKFNEHLWGIPIEKLTIPFLIILFSFLMTRLDDLIDFYKRQKRINETLSRTVK